MEAKDILNKTPMEVAIKYGTWTLEIQRTLLAHDVQIGTLLDLTKTGGENRADYCLPSFGLLSERFRTLELQVKQRYQGVANRLRDGEAIRLIVDSSGMIFGRASEWHWQKYGRDASRTPWRKMPLSIDPHMNAPQMAIIEDRVCDELGLDAVLAVDANVDYVIADRTYYSIAQTEEWSACGVLPMIPPPANAVVHDQPATRWHDHLVRYIKDKSIHAFRNKYGHGQRALVESQISRIKRCIGARLLTRRLESQQCKGAIIANLLNKAGRRYLSLPCHHAVAVDDRKAAALILMQLMHHARKDSLDAAICLPVPRLPIDALAVDFRQLVCRRLDPQHLPLAAHIEHLQDVVENSAQRQRGWWAASAAAQVRQDKALETLQLSISAESCAGYGLQQFSHPQMP
ncbi:transposase [Burkholderia vietnamiensis]|nr:transposase [Burkholderia vietnamiensis]